MAMSPRAVGAHPYASRSEVPETDGNWIEYARLAREAQRHMRLQAELFDPRNNVFGDPAWAIMLYLFEMQNLGKGASISATCSASGAAPTTGLRYIGALERIGFLVRTPDEHDRRRSYIVLSDEAFAGMLTYFRRCSPLMR